MVGKVGALNMRWAGDHEREKKINAKEEAEKLERESAGGVTNKDEQSGGGGAWGGAWV
jgi:hypothetical protein